MSSLLYNKTGRVIITKMYVYVRVLRKQKSHNCATRYAFELQKCYVRTMKTFDKYLL